MRLVTLLLVSISLGAAAQTTRSSDQDDTRRIIGEAISACLIAKDEAYTSWPSYSATDPVVVEETHYATFGTLSRVVAGRRVEYLTAYEVAQRARHVDGIGVLEVSPIVVMGDTLSVNLSDSNASWVRRLFRRDVLVHEYSGGCVAQFVYSVPRKRFEFASAALWGV